MADIVAADTRGGTFPYIICIAQQAHKQLHLNAAARIHICFQLDGSMLAAIILIYRTPTS